MTYSVIAYCREEEKFGLAVASCGLLSGALCPIFSKNGNYIGISQAYVSQKLKTKVSELVESGTPINKLEESHFSEDSHLDYRQFSIIDSHGNQFAHTGKNTTSFSDHIACDHFTVQGNMLASKDCLIEMSKEFSNCSTLPLTERLLRCLVRGKDTGGQKIEGKFLKERAAAIYIFGKEQSDNISLRIDMDDDAISKLRKLTDTYNSYKSILNTLECNPKDVPSLIEQEKILPLAPSIFSNN